MAYSFAKPRAEGNYKPWIPNAHDLTDLEPTFHWLAR